MKELRLLPGQYYDLTLSEFDALLSGVEAGDVRQWRHTRAILTLLYNVNVEQKDRKTDAEFMPLPGDDLVKPEPAYLPPNVMLHLLSNVFNLPLNQN